MRAELHGIQDSVERRRFTTGCIRAVITMPTVLAELAARILLLLAAVLAVRRYGDVSISVFSEAVVILVLLSGLSWWAARRPPFGPVAPRPAARALRVLTGLWLLVVLGWFMSPAAGGAGHDPAGWWVAGASLTSYWAAGLVLTAAGTRAATLSLIIVVAAAAVVVWLIWSVSSAAAWTGSPPVLLAVVAALLAGLFAKQVRQSAQPFRAALCSAAATAVGIFGCAACLTVARPAEGPDVMDPLVAVLLFGALAAAVVVASVGTER